MVKLLIVCLTALFGAHVEAMGPCNRDLDKVVKRHKVYPISGVANRTVCVDYVSRAEFDPSKYTASDVHFRPVINDFITVEITERKGEKIVSTAKDLRVYQPDPTKASTFVDYPKKGVNSTTVSVECVEGTGILVTHNCGSGTGGPTLSIASVRNKEVTPAILKECQKIADELAFRSVQFNRLDVSHCRHSR